MTTKSTEQAERLLSELALARDETNTPAYAHPQVWDSGNFQWAHGVVADLQAEVDRLTRALEKQSRISELVQGQLDRDAMCPDHRDKFHGRCAPCVVERRAESAESALLSLRAQIKQLEDAKDRTVDYIETAMRPISVKEACGEGLWDRAHRSGLQHALNAIRAEFAKVASLLSGDTQKEL